MKHLVLGLALLAIALALAGCFGFSMPKL